MGLFYKQKHLNHSSKLLNVIRNEVDKVGERKTNQPVTLSFQCDQNYIHHFLNNFICMLGNVVRIEKKNMELHNDSFVCYHKYDNVKSKIYLNQLGHIKMYNPN